MIADNFVSGLLPMQLNANKTAQFFIANEYYQVQLEKEWLVLTSLSSEERIPFHVWNGEVQIRRGVFWGTLQFLLIPKRACSAVGWYKVFLGRSVAILRTN